MSDIVIKTEKDDCEDVKPQIDEDGCVVSDGSGGGVDRDPFGGIDASVSANATGPTMGPKAIVEKTQAALKVASEAKNQLKLRLKEKYLLQQSNKTPSSADADHLQEENNKRFRVQTPVRYANQKHPTPPPLMQRPPQYAVGRPPLASSKCGEIFVTNNARKWTFVCTYCQKTTRDIGEFVCHIKFKHMLDQYHEDGDEDYENEENVTEQLHETYPNNLPDDSYNNHDQDYFDCTSYLDVNVHTDPDEMSPNNGVKPKANSKATPTSHAKDSTSGRQNRKNKYLVNLLDDDEEQADNIKKSNDDLKNEFFDYEMEEDEEGVVIAEDDNDEMEGIDDDNLLFLRSNSVEETLGDGEGGGGSGGGGGGGRSDGKGGVKKYRSHVRGKAYCNLCNKTFQYYSLYRNHMIKHSNITPYKCQYCSKAFKSKQAIRYHMNTHTKEVQYSCPLCPTTYGTENQFITHVLNHESDTCFPCMVCAKILKSDQEREDHLSTHTEERPYGCTFCNKRFRQKHHLSNHLKLHCQYRCDFCKEEFSSTQTQRRPYACPTCEEYPHIRTQVEKQRSKSLNSNEGIEVNPLDITNYENRGQDAADATECVDLASDEEDDESETSLMAGGGNNGTGGGSSGGVKRFQCQFCPRGYKQTSALNYHMRQKHPLQWAELKDFKKNGWLATITAKIPLCGKHIENRKLPTISVGENKQAILFYILNLHKVI